MIPCCTKGCREKWNGTIDKDFLLIILCLVDIYLNYTQINQRKFKKKSGEERCTYHATVQVIVRYLSYSWDILEETKRKVAVIKNKFIIET